MLRRVTFPQWLAAVAVLALAVRVIYALHVRDLAVVGDALTFHRVGAGLADGNGFVDAVRAGEPTAEHPPLMEVLVAAFDLIGAHGYFAHRLLLGAVGTVTVVLIGLVGRRVGGPRLGLTAAVVAALYPMLFTADGSLMSETLYGVFLVASLLAALRLREAPSVGRAAALGALIALAALTRGEALALFVLLAGPIAFAGADAWRGRLRLWGAVVGVGILVLLPWTVFNLTRFEEPVLISTNSNGVFVGANCSATYHQPYIGAWRFQCYSARRPGEDESQFFLRQRSEGLDYAFDHAGRWPAVVGARLLRLTDLGWYGQSLYLNASEGRSVDVMRWGIWVFRVLALLAIAGAVLLWRRRQRTSFAVLLAPVAMVFCVAIVTYGGTRFRFGAEPSIVLLASVALVAGAERLARRRSSASPTVAPTPVSGPVAP